MINSIKKQPDWLYEEIENMGSNPDLTLYVQACRYYLMQNIDKMLDYAHPFYNMVNKEWDFYKKKQFIEKIASLDDALDKEHTFFRFSFTPIERLEEDVLDTWMEYEFKDARPFLWAFKNIENRLKFLQDGLMREPYNEDLLREGIQCLMLKLGRNEKLLNSNPAHVNLTNVFIIGSVTYGLIERLSDAKERALFLELLEDKVIPFGKYQYFIHSPNYLFYGFKEWVEVSNKTWRFSVDYFKGWDWLQCLDQLVQNEEE